MSAKPKADIGALVAFRTMLLLRPHFARHGEVTDVVGVVFMAAGFAAEMVRPGQAETKSADSQFLEILLNAVREGYAAGQGIRK